MSELIMELDELFLYLTMEAGYDSEQVLHAMRTYLDLMEEVEG